MEIAFRVSKSIYDEVKTQHAELLDALDIVKSPLESLPFHSLYKGSRDLVVYTGDHDYFVLYVAPIIRLIFSDNVNGVPKPKIYVPDHKHLHYFETKQQYLNKRAAWSTYCETSEEIHIPLRFVSRARMAALLGSVLETKQPKNAAEDVGNLLSPLYSALYLDGDRHDSLLPPGELLSFQETFTEIVNFWFSVWERRKPAIKTIIGMQWVKDDEVPLKLNLSTIARLKRMQRALNKICSLEQNQA